VNALVLFDFRLLLKDIPMTVRSRVPQDFRRSSRAIALLECKLTYEDSEHNAVIVDLSQKGALISSPFLPPADSVVALTIQSKHLKKELKLRGKVTRSTKVNTDHGPRGRYVVNFNHTPLDLISLLTKLHLN
jgi:hypothetical protein